MRFPCACCATEAHRLRAVPRPVMLQRNARSTLGAGVGDGRAARLGRLRIAGAQARQRPVPRHAARQAAGSPDAVAGSWQAPAPCVGKPESEDHDAHGIDQPLHGDADESRRQRASASNAASRLAPRDAPAHFARKAPARPDRTPTKADDAEFGEKGQVQAVRVKRARLAVGQPHDGVEPRKSERPDAGERKAVDHSAAPPAKSRGACSLRSGCDAR